jgi:Lipase (class 3)
MLSDKQIVDLVASLYDASNKDWDHLIAVDGSWCAIKRIDGIDYMVWRGSTTAVDWLEDFDDAAIPSQDGVLGTVHPGFIIGVRAVLDQVNPLLGGSVVVCGHSLGAGHSILHAGLLAAAGRYPEAVVVFGEPRAGGAKLSGILAPVPIRSYCNGDANGHDLVTDVPFAIPLVAPYVHPRPLLHCSASPPPDDDWGVVAYHHVQLYQKALA